MSEARKRLIDEIDSLRALRDETRLQLKLGRAEARDLWEKLEKDWQHLEGRAKVLASQSKEEAAAVGEAVQLLADQLRAGYRRLKNLL
jgi:hypothetical protein